jgi:hypothetical protein
VFIHGCGWFFVSASSCAEAGDNEKPKMKIAIDRLDKR